MSTVETGKYNKSVLVAGMAGVLLLPTAMIFVNADFNQQTVDCEVMNDANLRNIALTVAQIEPGPGAIPEIAGNYAIFRGILSGTCSMVYGSPVSK